MTSETSSGARISPIAIKPEMRIKALADEDVAKIHQATLTVLEQTGVKFPCEKALHILAEAGADVDFKTQIVKIRPDLLMKTLAKAPAEFVMGSRGSQALDVNLDGRKIYCGTSGTGTATVDLETRERRPSVKEDVAMMALISDYLSSISFYWPMVAARDCPTETIALHEMEAAFTSTDSWLKECLRITISRPSMKLWQSDPKDIFWIGISPSGMFADSGNRVYHTNGHQKCRIFVTPRRQPWIKPSGY